MSAIATLLDVNIWLARAIPKHPHHQPTMDWFKTQTDPGSSLFNRATQNSFLRLMSTRSILREYSLEPFSNADAWVNYENILNDPIIGFAEEPPGVEAIWKNLTAYTTPSPKVWMDAYLAAFAIAGQYAFLTTDGGFRQFKGLNLILIS